MDKPRKLVSMGDGFAILHDDYEKVAEELIQSLGYGETPAGSEGIELHRKAVSAILAVAVFPSNTHVWADLEGNPKPFHWDRLLAIRGIIQ
jgi:hypothetical protein